MYLDGKGAEELATNGDVGVVILVTDGDLFVAVGVEIVVDEDNLVDVDDDGRSMTVLFVFGELKSNDNRDL